MQGIPEHLEGYFSQQQFRLSFGIHNWYSKLSDHTFPTSFIELSVSDIEAILECNTKGGYENVDKLDNETKSNLEKLNQELDAKIKEFGTAFIKLDSRSPKDVCFDSAKYEPIRKRVLEYMEEELSKLNNKIEMNSQSMLDIFMKSMYQAMMVTNGNEALFLLCGSSRVREDLQQLVKLHPFGLRNYICIRKWDQYVAANPKLEFRAFVYKNSLTAISQYDYISYYPELNANKNQIQSQILSFFTDILQPTLSQDYESYIADFFVGDNDWTENNTDSLKERKVRLVELNSFESWTGACLFSWNYDREIILNGPLETRVVTKAPEIEIDDYIPPKWKEYILKDLSQHLILEKSDPSPSSSSTCNIS